MDFFGKCDQIHRKTSFFVKLILSQLKKKQILISENAEYIDQYNDTTIFDVNSQENTAC